MTSVLDNLLIVMRGMVEVPEPNPNILNRKAPSGILSVCVKTDLGDCDIVLDAFVSLVTIDHTDCTRQFVSTGVPVLRNMNRMQLYCTISLGVHQPSMLAKKVT